MPTYTTWAKILELYPRAADVEATGGDQTQLIDDMSELFHGYIRHLHKYDLTTVDKIVDRAVALLCINELKTRRGGNLAEREVASFDHISGLFFAEGIEAHGYIDSIRQGKYTLSQDAHQHDVHNPEVLPASGNTGVGNIKIWLPIEWKDDQIAYFEMKCTTAGRVDDEDARFSIFRDNDATAISTDVTPPTDWTEIVDKLYWRSWDDSDSGNSFEVDDVWTFTVFPSTAVAQGGKAGQVEFYAG